jgi:hypothetical protein
MGLLKRKPGQEAAETGSGIGAAERALAGRNIYFIIWDIRC